MNNIEEKVIAWAKERNITNKENCHKQLVKTYEELGEVSRAVLKNDLPEIKDGIGDVLVTLAIQANMHGLTLHECFEAAYNEIKDRKGKTENGVFIKQ